MIMSGEIAPLRLIEMQTSKRAAQNFYQGCIITTPDYDSLQLVYTARRLWQSDDIVPPPEQKQDMNRRFAESYKILAQVRQLTTASREGD